MSLLTYPVNFIATPDGQLNVLQLSDLHIDELSKAAKPTADWSSLNCCQSFEKLLEQALNEPIRCDLIIVTGDLVSKICPDIYNYIFEVLKKTKLPFACIAGNHDVTAEEGCHLPFHQRTFLPKAADERLLSRHVIESEHWQLLLIDSAVPGKVAGKVTSSDIDWLSHQLATCNKPALIALHHHVTPMNSDWIDEHIADNADKFWQKLQRFDNLRVIVSGHTHQEHVKHQNGVTVYTTPSTCYQFKPLEDDFTFDDNARPGYRWLQLGNNGQVASWVKRMDT